MLASIPEVQGSLGFFLGLPRPEDVYHLQMQPSMELALSGSPSLRRNPSDGEGGRAGDGPTSSGSGHTAGTQGRKASKECQNAQKRFRARQKERMSCLEREVADKKAAFDQLAAENLFLRARTNILEKVVSCRDEQLSIVQALEDRCRIEPNARTCFGGGSSTTDASGTPDSHEYFRNLKKEQVIPQYKAFLAEVSRHLLHCQYPCSDPDSPIVQQVTACVERMGYVLKHVLLLNSPLMRQLQSINMETQQPAVAAEAHWDDVVASLQLGPEQRSDILSVLDLYHGLIHKVYEERKLIKTALGSGVGLFDLQCPTLTSRNPLALEMELLERLSHNLSKEHTAHTMLACFFFGKVLAPPQFAKVAVYSYPFFPDCLAVALAVSRQASQLQPLTTLGSGNLDCPQRQPGR